MTTDERAKILGIHLAQEVKWIERLAQRVAQVEDDVARLEQLMGPLEQLPGAGPGEPQTALEQLSYVIGFLQGRINTLEDRLRVLERANDP